MWRHLDRVQHLAVSAAVVDIGACHLASKGGGLDASFPLNVVLVCKFSASLGWPPDVMLLCIHVHCSTGTSGRLRALILGTVHNVASVDYGAK